LTIEIISRNYEQITNIKPWE